MPNHNKFQWERLPYWILAWAARLALVLISSVALGYVFFSLIYLTDGRFQMGVAYILKGVELLFLAPLTYLVLGTMNTFVLRVRKQLRILNEIPAAGNALRMERTPSEDVGSPLTIGVSGHKGGLENGLAEPRELLDQAFHLVHRVKQSIAGLLAALTLTDFIGRIINEQPFDLTTAYAEIGVISMCLLYYFVQSRSD